MDTNSESQQHLGPADLPFSTDDGMLAFALYLANVPFTLDVAWCRNVYTREMLKGYGFNGIDIREAAKAASRAGKRGDVRFYFQRTRRLRSLLNAYTDQEKLIKESEGKSSLAFTWLIAADMEPDERAVRLACLVLKMRGEFMNGWKDMVPHVRIRSEGSIEKSEYVDSSGRRVIHSSHPGYREFPATATDEILKRLELL